MVKIRLKRYGRRNHGSWRVNAVDSRSPRDGRVIEELGWYDPRNLDPTKQFKVDAERVKYWLSVGAQPSDTIRSLLKKNGIDPTCGQKIAKS